MIPKILVTKDQWLQTGMEHFALSGEDGLIIEKMASALGCSKSSFYWYFKDRNEFISRIIERWVELTTEQVISHSSLPEKAEDQVTNLLTQMFSATGKGDFLFFLRKLGNQYPNYREKLEQVEHTRMKYARELLVKVGMEPEVAEQKSRLLYHYYLGWYERFKYEKVGDEERNSHIKMLRYQLLGMKEG